MAINPTYVWSNSRVDRSGEIGRFSLNIDPAEVVEPPSADLTAVRTAINSVCDGVELSFNVSITNKLSNAANATVGQREEKWLVQYEDTTTHSLYQVELPCRDTTIQPPVGTDEVDLTVAPWVAFKTAFENGAVVSPDGNGILVRAVRLVGRNI